MSTGKYRALVDRAHQQAFRVRLIYVFLTSAELNVARVRDRVAGGGHDVPEASIRARRERSFEQLSWFFEHADEVDIFDNSGANPRLVARKTESEITVYGWLIPELLAALETAQPGMTAKLGKGRRRGRRRGLGARIRTLVR